MTKKDALSVRERQDPLRQRYVGAPAEALITDGAKTTWNHDASPFHGQVVPGTKDYGVVWPFGIHHAVGGYHDAPNPGDMLCAALAACLDSTLRIIADRLGISLTKLEVEVTAEVDVRGTLMVDRAVPVGFQTMRCQVKIGTAEGTDSKLVQKLVAASEHSCVNLRTLLANLPIETSVHEA